LFAVAAASCVPYDLSKAYKLLPERGAVISQAYANLKGRDKAAMLLREGQAPDAIIKYISSSVFDNDRDLRQYGIVDVKGRVATFTGLRTDPWSGSRTDKNGPFAFAIQGNYLTSEKVLSGVENEIVHTRSGDLAEIAMRALEGGAKNRQGDSRCTKYGIPATSALLHAQSENGAVHLSKVIRNGQSAIYILRQALTEWRLKHQSAPEKRKKQNNKLDAESQTNYFILLCITTGLVLGISLLFRRLRSRTRSAKNRG